MRPPAWILWGGATLASAIALAVTAPGAVRACGSANTELKSLRSTAAHAEVLASLRSPLPVEGVVEESQGTLAERVARALANAGLPSSALASLSPESQLGPGNVGNAKRRLATLTLASITLPELGRFLDAWRRREPGWTVAAIDLVPEARGQASLPTPGGDLPIRAVLTIESIALDREGEP